LNAVIKKKIKPYPISVQLTGTSGVLKGKIIKLVPKGFIVNLEGSFVHVHETYKVAFEIPLARHDINSDVIVIKTYDRSTPEHDIERLAEVHFTHLSDADRKNIQSFLRAINQSDE
jgi:hypothetical protein